MWIIRFSLILQCMLSGLGILRIGISNHVSEELAQNSRRASLLVIKAENATFWPGISRQSTTNHWQTLDLPFSAICCSCSFCIFSYTACPLFLPTNVGLWAISE